MRAHGARVSTSRARLTFVLLTLLTVSGRGSARGELRCASGVRRGPCQVADTSSLVFDAAGRPSVVMNFGVFAAAASSYLAVCEEAFGGVTPTHALLTASGMLSVPSWQGIFRAPLAAPCTFALVPGLPVGAFVQQLVPDPTLPTRQWALVGAGDERGLYVSEDDGATFSLRHTFTKGEVWWRLVVRSGEPRRVFVAGPGRVGPFALAISADGGATFSVRDPVADLADVTRDTVLLDVSEDSPSRLFFARFTPDGNDEVWVSADDGASVQRTLVLPAGHVVGGMTFGASPRAVYVGSRRLLLSSAGADAALFTSSDGGLSWAPPVLSPPSGPRYRCLAWRGDALYACAGGADAGDDFLVGRSLDGVTWRPVVTLSDVQAPPACLIERCDATVGWLCMTYGICAPSLPDGGSDGGEDPGGHAGCGCQVGRPSQSSAAPLGLLFGGLLLYAHGAQRRTGARRKNA